MDKLSVFGVHSAHLLAASPCHPSVLLIRWSVILNLYLYSFFVCFCVFSFLFLTSLLRHLHNSLLFLSSSSPLLLWPFFICLLHHCLLANHILLFPNLSIILALFVVLITLFLSKCVYLLIHVHHHLLLLQLVYYLLHLLIYHRHPLLQVFPRFLLSIFIFLSSLSSTTYCSSSASYSHIPPLSYCYHYLSSFSISSSSFASSSSCLAGVSSSSSNYSSSSSLSYSSYTRPG